MQKHQQQYWPQLNYAFSPTQGQLPLVNLNEDVEDTLGLLYPQSPLDFGDVSIPLLGLPSLQTCGALVPSTMTMSDNQQTSPLMLPSSKKTEKPRRPVGRPRSQAPPPSTAPMAGAAAGPSAARQQKRGRGPKPKYIFATDDEALDARKERNRKAALESYYRKRQKTDALTQEINRLKAENAKLEKLAVDIDMGVVVLEEATEEGLGAWLAQNTR